jgi:hypothetical protein
MSLSNRERQANFRARQREARIAAEAEAARAAEAAKAAEAARAAGHGRWLAARDFTARIGLAWSSFRRGEEIRGEDTIGSLQRQKAPVIELCDCLCPFCRQVDLRSERQRQHDAMTAESEFVATRPFSITMRRMHFEFAAGEAVRDSLVADLVALKAPVSPRREVTCEHCGMLDLHSAE